MKAVILAAGKGIRMRPLTLHKPKPMIEVGGKPLLYHVISVLPKKIKEIIIVIGYKGDKIQNYFGNKFDGRKIKYIRQKEKKGTAHALLLCKKSLKKGKFLLLYADDLHDKKSIERCIKHELSVLVARTEKPERFGVVLTNSRKRILEIEEKPEKPKSNLVSTGALVLDERIFNYKPKKHANGEFYITDMMSGLIRVHKVMAQEASFWFPIGYPDDIKKAEKILKKANKKSPNQIREYKQKKNI